MEVDGHRAAKRGKISPERKQQQQSQVPQQQQQSATVIKKKDQYNPADNGPFLLIAKGEKATSEAVLAKLLRELNFIDRISEIKRMNDKTIRIKAINYKTANKIITNTVLDLKGYDIFIPKSHLYVTGIANIPLDFTLEDITADISRTDAIDIQRITRWNNSTMKAEDTTAVKISFRECLPESIKILKVPFKVRPYIPRPMLCKNCKNYGHLAKFCKSAVTCKKCLLTHNEDLCESTELKCKHCPGNHQTGDRSCPEYIMQVRINTIKSTKKISYFEAAKLAKDEIIVKTDKHYPKNVLNPTERITEFQDPNSNSNIIANLKQTNENYHRLLNEIIKMLSTSMPSNPIITEIINTTKQILIPSPASENSSELLTPDHTKTQPITPLNQHGTPQNNSSQYT